MFVCTYTLYTNTTHAHSQTHAHTHTHKHTHRPTYAHTYTVDAASVYIQSIVQIFVMFAFICVCVYVFVCASMCACCFYGSYVCVRVKLRKNSRFCLLPAQ